MEQLRRARRVPQIGVRVAAVALCAGVLGMATPATAWADATSSGETPGATAAAGRAATPSAPPRRPVAKQWGSAKESVADQAEKPAPPAKKKPESGASDTDGATRDPASSTADGQDAPRRPWFPHRAHRTSARPAAENGAAIPAAPRRLGRDHRESDGPASVTRKAAASPSRSAVAVNTPASRSTEATTPAPVGATVTELNPARSAVTPEALSPLGKLVRLPGRLVNAVLQFFDITTTAHGPRSPIRIAPPINDLLFAVFREVERRIGLDRTPGPQPPFPTVDYTGPTTGKTPTVAQFLNASAAGYGLGTTPGGLTPFVVNGFQVSSINILNGMAARVWVTPDQQIVIAYQGTTGGTNLLFNPFIAVTQILTDLQVVYTHTTPWAFRNALRFAERVEAAAAHQGYGTDDVFVTGHSLGGWEAQYVAQQIGLPGIGFETPGMNSTVPGNGRDSMFVNIETYGDAAPLLSTDLPGLQPFMPPYVPDGGTKPHFGSIVMIGDPDAVTPLLNAATLYGTGPLRTLVFLADLFGNFFQYHLPGIQAYHLDVVPDPGVVPWLGTAQGPVNVGWGELTIPELLAAASESDTLHRSTVAA